MKYKIVNTFTGWEDDELFENEDDAYEKKDRILREFYTHIGTQNLSLRLSVVTENAEYYFDHRRNEFRWMET